MPDKPSPTATIAVPGPGQLGEGPVWDDRSGELVWVDISGRLIHHWNPLTGESRSLATWGDVGAVVLCEDGAIVAAIECELWRVDDEEQWTLQAAVEPKPGVRFNDCRADPRGRLWAGTLHRDRQNGVAALYRLDPGGELTLVLPDRTISNGIGWSPDERTMYYIDSTTQPQLGAVPGRQDLMHLVVFTRGTCFFSTKVESGQLAGYDKVIIMQSHGGTRNGLTPNGFTCGGQGHAFTITASAICIGHRAGHLLFNDTPGYVGAEGADMPAIGTLGAAVDATTTFDGWGTIHLLDGTTLDEIDNYSIPEAIDPAYASGFGTMSVHEVAMDKAENVAYLSWYDAGIRVVKFGSSGIEEVGHYIDANGNDFWGVEAHRLPGDATETTYILASDRDSGLWIFRYTGG